MTRNTHYNAKQFDLNGLNGISDHTLEMHFKLYEGYVKETNNLTERISEFLKDGKVAQDEMPAYSELKRRLGFEYNGMVLHEHYFGNMKRGGSGNPDKTSAFFQAAEQSFGSYDIWKQTSSASGRCGAWAGRYAMKIRLVVNYQIIGSACTRLAMSQGSIRYLLWMYGSTRSFWTTNRQNVRNTSKHSFQTSTGKLPANDLGLESIFKQAARSDGQRSLSGSSPA